MKNDKVAPVTMDEYFDRFPKEIQEILGKFRSTIHQAAPAAQEAISYGIPTFKLQGNLVHFAAFKNHFGFFPTSSGIAEFKEALSDYQCSKGTVRFPFGQPVPFSLVAKIVKFRVQENLQRAAMKAKPSSARSMK
jgi:uncharacterized protein YdhG (YjbR/CyaY superfamily)